MSNIRYSAIVSDAAGAIGGVVFSRNKGGAVIRTRRKGINPRSGLQETRRGNASYLAGYWSATLTQAQRDDWNAYVAGTNWTNKLGDSIEITGNAAFLRLNTMLVAIGVAVRAAAPTAMGHAGGITQDFAAENDVPNLGMLEPGGAFDKDLDGDYVIWSMALPVEPGNAQSTKGFRIVGSVEGDSVAAPTFPDDITPAYTFQADQKVTVRSVHIDPDFRMTAPVLTTVVAAPSI